MNILIYDYSSNIYMDIDDNDIDSIIWYNIIIMNSTNYIYMINSNRYMMIIYNMIYRLIL